MKEEKFAILLKSRIDKQMQSKGLKRYSLAQLAGISNPTIQNWFGKKRYEPTLSSIYKISIALDISMSALFTEEDEELWSVSTDEKELLKAYRLLTPDKKKLLIDVADNFKRD